jgi:hypothetical protein
MSYHEGSNWQAKKEDEGKPLYDNTEAIKKLQRETGCGRSLAEDAVKHSSVFQEQINYITKHGPKF